MTENRVIKVVWLCHFSNYKVHEKLELQYNRLIKIIRKIAHRSVSLEVPEFANWITNGIVEFEKIKGVELHIVSPYPHLKARKQEFSENGIFFHFFRNEDDTIPTFLYKQIFHPHNFCYKKNSHTIRNIIGSIQPQIIHLFGAENPYYAAAILNLPKSFITIAQLQTLMNDPDFKKRTIDDRIYRNRSEIEKAIIQSVDYVATPDLKYREIIRQIIAPNAIILNTSLALKDPIVTEPCNKKFDFVYFAANISKAADLAIEAFAIAHEAFPGITLDIIGGYSHEYKGYLDCIIEKYGIKNVITFEGSLPTHGDVLKRIRLARFALLPLRIDLISGTIREAMSNGLPVITTDTGELGTQKLNLKKQNVLISPIGDHQSMANNMLKVLKDEGLADSLRQNAYQTRLEVSSNEATIQKYVKVYNACIDHSQSCIPLPTSITVV